MAGSVVTLWYKLALQHIRAGTSARLRKQLRCSYRRIARLPPAIGVLCDELKAPLNVVQQIAHAPAECQRARASRLLGELVARRARHLRRPAPPAALALLEALNDAAPSEIQRAA